MADKAFRDLLKKHHRPTDLRDAAREGCAPFAASEREKASDALLMRLRVIAS